MNVPVRIAFLQTHPIQYMAPWFRYIAANRPDIDVTVLYAAEPSAVQQGAGFDAAFRWDIDLTEGYRHRILEPSLPGQRFDDTFHGSVDARDIGAALREVRPDVVVVPGWHSRFYVRAIRECRRLGIPMLYRGDSNRSSAPRGFRRLGWHIRTRRRLRLFNGYLSVGTRIREHLLGFRISEPLIASSPWAVDNEAFAAAAEVLQDPSARDAARAGLGARPGDLLVLVAGKFIARKRVDDVIAAAARLGPDVAVAMVGAGPTADHARDVARRLGVRVAWCGFLNQTAIRTALAAADCVAVPSEWETWGLIVNEALAAGTPCVVSDGVPAGDDLIRESTGAVYPAGDVAGLADSLARVRECLAAHAITPESCRAAVARHSFKEATDGLVAGTQRVLARCHLDAGSNAGTPRVLGVFGQMFIMSGVERMSFEVLRVLREQGAAIHCVVNWWGSARIVDDVDAIGASWSTGFYRYRLTKDVAGWPKIGWDVLCTSLGLLRDAWRFRPTHAFVPDFTGAIRNAPALWLLRILGVRVVLRLGTPPEQGRFERLFWRQIIDRVVDVFVANSRFIEQALLHHGVSRDKVQVIHNTAPSRPREVETIVKVPGRIVYVGQIIPPKGVLVLLDAVAVLVARGVDVTLDVVGDIEGWEPATYLGYRQKVRARAAMPDLAQRVRLLGVREDVPFLMAAASVHCLPSLIEGREGFAVVTLEAKRAGVPSVVTPSGSLPETVTHAADGWVCRDDSAVAVAEGLQYFLSQPDVLARASVEARRSGARYSRPRFAAEWRRVFSAEPAVPLGESEVA